MKYHEYQEFTIVPNLSPFFYLFVDVVDRIIAADLRAGSWLPHCSLHEPSPVDRRPSLMIALFLLGARCNHSISINSTTVVLIVIVIELYQ